MGYAVLILFGHLRDYFGKRSNRSRYNQAFQKSSSGIAPLLKSWENFYTRRLYHRIQDVFNRPLKGRPGGRISVYERETFDGNKTMSIGANGGDFDMVEEEGVEVDREEVIAPRGNAHNRLDFRGNVLRDCINLGSYNYLGFADDWDISCRKEVMSSLTTDPNQNQYPISCSLPPLESGGYTSLHKTLETNVAKFLGKEDCICLNMGFNTNATTIPALVKKGDLIISDALNHTSIVNGSRLSGGSIRVFKHNDCEDLERVIRDAIVSLLN